MADQDNPRVSHISATNMDDDKTSVVDIEEVHVSAIVPSKENEGIIEHETGQSGIYGRFARL